MVLPEPAGAWTMTERRGSAVPGQTGAIQGDVGDFGDVGQIAVEGQQCRPVAQRDCCDHAVNQTPRGDPGCSAVPINANREIKIKLGIDMEQAVAQQHVTQLTFLAIPCCTGADLHDDWLSNRKTVAVDQLTNAQIGPTAGGSQVLDPGRRISQ